MKRFYYRLRAWWMDKKHPPVVVIDRSGWATDRPQVHVSVASYRGSQGVYSWDADDVGEARATYYGKGLADIMHCRVIDRRSTENEPQKKCNQGVPLPPLAAGA